MISTITKLLLWASVCYLVCLVLLTSRQTLNHVLTRTIQTVPEAAHRRAVTYYQAGLIHSGIKDRIYSLLIPTESERNASRGMKDLGQPWFNWVETRLAAVFQLFRIFLIRLCYLLNDGYLLLILSGITVWDSCTVRIGQRSRFKPVSPIQRRTVLLLIMLWVFSSFILLLLPIPVNWLLFDAMVVALCGITGWGIIGAQRWL